MPSGGIRGTLGARTRPLPRSPPQCPASAARPPPRWVPLRCFAAAPAQCRLRRCRLLVLRGPPAAATRPALPRRHLPRRRWRDRADGQLADAAHPLGGGNERPPGPARNDERARSIADALVPRAYMTPERRRPAPRAGLDELDGRPGGQHLVFDAEVVDGLVYAYRARKELQPARATVNRIRAAISNTARGSFWRYPTIRLNQVNWYALMYAADADRHRRPGAAQARPAPAVAALHPRRARDGDRRRQLRAGDALPLPPPRAPEPPDERGLRGVREHRPQLHPLL